MKHSSFRASVIVTDNGLTYMGRLIPNGQWGYGADMFLKGQTVEIKEKCMDLKTKKMIRTGKQIKANYLGQKSKQRTNQKTQTQERGMLKLTKEGSNQRKRLIGRERFECLANK